MHPTIVYGSGFDLVSDGRSACANRNCLERRSNYGTYEDVG